jgi:hypothetical protein
MVAPKAFSLLVPGSGNFPSQVYAPPQPTVTCLYDQTSLCQEMLECLPLESTLLSFSISRCAIVVALSTCSAVQTQFHVHYLTQPQNRIRYHQSPNSLES